MADSLQTDHYGRVVDISTEDLVKGLTSKIKGTSFAPGSAAARLNSMGKQNEKSHSDLADAVKPLLSMFSDKLEIDQTIKLLEQIHAGIKELDKKKEEYQASKKGVSPKSGGKSVGASDFKDLSNGFEKALGRANKDNMWGDRSRAKAVDKFLFEATHGHSLRVHDYTAQYLLQGIAKDIKHIGMILAGTVGEPLTAKQSKIVGSFDVRIPEIDEIKKINLQQVTSNKQLIKIIEETFHKLNGVEHDVKSAKSQSTKDIQDIADNNVDVKGLTDIAPDLHDLDTEVKKAAKSVGELEHAANDFGGKIHDVESTAKAMKQAMSNHAATLGDLSYKIRLVGNQLEDLVSEPQLEKIAIGMQRLGSMKKWEKDQMRSLYHELKKALEDKDEKLAKSIAEQLANTADKITKRQERDEKRSATFDRIRSVFSELRGLIDTIRDTLSPHIYGIGRRFDMFETMARVREETGQWVRDIHHNLMMQRGLSGTMLTREDGTARWGYRAAENVRNVVGWLEEANTLAGEYNITGQETAKIQTVLIRNLQRGVNSLTRWTSLSRQGLQLGRMIGVDAERTSDELTDWHLQMGFTVSQTGQLGRDMMSISRVTGVTGERMFEAAKSSRQFADNMRSAGTLTSEAARNLMQYSTVAARRGTERIVSPLVEAMSSSVNLYDRAGAGTFSLLMRAAHLSDNPRLMQSLQEGTVLQNRESGMQMAIGLRRVLESFTGGRRVQDLDPTRRMQLNLGLQTAFGIQLNELVMAAETLEETFMTLGQRIQSIDNQLEGRVRDGRVIPGVTLTREEQDLLDRRNRLSQLEIGERMNDAMRRLAQTGGASGAGDIRAALEGIRHATDHLRGPYAAEEQARLRDEAASMQRTLEELERGGFSDRTAVQELVERLDATINQGQLWERMYQLDQNTFQRENQERYQRRIFEDQVRTKLLHITRWSDPVASLQNTHLGLVHGFAQIFERLTQVILAIFFLTTFMGRLFGGIFGLGGGGIGGGGGIRGGSGVGGFFRRAGVGIGTTVLTMDALRGFAETGNAEGALLAMLTGRTAPTEGGLDTVGVLGRGTAVGFALGGPMGAILGTAAAGVGELISQVNRFGQVVDQQVRLQQSYTVAVNNAIGRLHSPEGREEIRREVETTPVAEVTRDLGMMERDLRDMENQLQIILTRNSWSRDNIPAPYGAGILGWHVLRPRWAGRDPADINTDIGSARSLMERMRSLREQISVRRETINIDDPLSIMMDLIPRDIRSGPQAHFLRDELRRYLELRPTDAARMTRTIYETLGSVQTVTGTSPSLREGQRIDALIAAGVPTDMITRLRNAGGLEPQRMTNSHIEMLMERMQPMVEAQDDAIDQLVRSIRTRFNVDARLLLAAQQQFVRNRDRWNVLEREHEARRFHNIYSSEAIDANLRTRLAPFFTSEAERLGIPLDQFMNNDQALIDALNFSMTDAGIFGRADVTDEQRGRWRENINVLIASLRRRMEGDLPVQELADLRRMFRAHVSGGSSLISTAFGDIRQAIDDALSGPGASTMRGGAGAPGRVPSPFSPAPIPIVGPGGTFRSTPSTLGEALSPMNPFALFTESLPRLFSPDTITRPMTPFPTSPEIPIVMTGVTGTGTGPVLHLPLLDSAAIAGLSPAITAGLEPHLAGRSIRTIPTRELYELVNSVSPTDEAHRRALGELRTRLTPLISESDRIHHGYDSAGISPYMRLPSRAREYIRAYTGKSDSEILRMPTGEFLRHLNAMATNPSATMGEHASVINEFRRSLTARPSTPSSGGNFMSVSDAMRNVLDFARRPTGSGSTTPFAPVAPGFTSSPARGVGFFQNVNRVEDMIWEYVPNLNMLDTHQIAIAAWDEYRPLLARGEANENTLREIIRRRLAEAGVSLPSGPATETPFGRIEFGPDGRPIITPSSGWGAITSTTDRIADILSEILSVIAPWSDTSVPIRIDPETIREVPTAADNFGSFLERFGISAADYGVDLNEIFSRVDAVVHPHEPIVDALDSLGVSGVLSDYGLDLRSAFYRIRNGLFEIPILRTDTPLEETGWPFGDETPPVVPGVPISEDMMAGFITSLLLPTLAGVPDEIQTATTTASSALEEYESNRLLQEIDAVETTGPLNVAVEHLDEIETNTRDTAEETRQVRELMTRLVSMLSSGGSGVAHGDSSSNLLPGSPPNFWSWGLDMSMNPNMGSRRPNGIT